MSRDYKRTMPPKQRDVGKDKKKLRVELLDHGGDAISRRKSSELSGLESPMVVMHKGMQIGLKDNELKMVEDADLATLLQAMIEF